MSVNAYEQYMLELINRARLDPAGEAALLGLDADALGLPSGSLDVLAFDNTLARAATDHSDWMLANDTFSHTGAGGTSAGERIEEAGYIFATGDTWAENIALWGTSGTLDREQATSIMHANLFESDGHRANLLSDAVTQVGVAIERGDYYGYDTGMTTQNFASAGGKHFLTGVVYDDTDGDSFYSIGEGRADVTFKTGAKSQITPGAGGYSIKVTNAGVRELVIRDGDSRIAVEVDMDGGNAKVDLVNGDTLMTTASLTFKGGALNAGVLGLEAVNLVGNGRNNDLTGNDAANRLVGNGGRDDIAGEGGADKLRGGAGNDTIDGGGGADNIRGAGDDDDLSGGNGSDVINGGRGADTLQGQDGDDVLYGSTGQDILKGSTGDDLLHGGGGRDRLTGGAGADVFVFNNGAGRDRITDFEAGTDHLHFAAARFGWSDVAFTDTAQGLLVEVGAVDVVLEGLLSGDLDKGDFLFG